MSSKYDALPKAGDDVYYSGEGPFDPPDSDSENESLLEKQRYSPGAAERGFAGEQDIAASGLVVGRSKVCILPKRLRRAYEFQYDRAEMAIFIKISGDNTERSYPDGSDNWVYGCNVVFRDILPTRAWHQTYHHGRCLRRNILRSEGISALGACRYLPIILLAF